MRQRYARTTLMGKREKVRTFCNFCEVFVFACRSDGRLFGPDVIGYRLTADIIWNLRYYSIDSSFVYGVYSS